jgi:tRNA-splicing endonuclease subunit Sen34
VHDPAAHHSATPTQLESWDAQRQRGIAQKIRETELRKGEDRAAIADAASEAAAQKKRAEREARRQRQLAEAAAGPEVIVEGAAVTNTPSSSQSTTSAAVYTVSVPTTSDAFAWYEPGAHTYETLDAARSAGVWTYPATEEERAKCEVFRDLWEKGYYLGGGGKFGGDWLVYPGALFFPPPELIVASLTPPCVHAGDPLRYHSHFVATVQTSPSAPLRPMEIVAHGRLGTATKKAHLLCGWDAASREVTYISIEWAGFG